MFIDLTFPKGVTTDFFLVWGDESGIVGSVAFLPTPKMS